MEDGRPGERMCQPSTCEAQGGGKSRRICLAPPVWQRARACCDEACASWGSSPPSRGCPGAELGRRCRPPGQLWRGRRQLLRERILGGWGGLHLLSNLSAGPGRAQSRHAAELSGSPTCASRPLGQGCPPGGNHSGPLPTPNLFSSGTWKAPHTGWTLSVPKSMVPFRAR